MRWILSGGWTSPSTPAHDEYDEEDASNSDFSRERVENEGEDGNTERYPRSGGNDDLFANHQQRETFKEELSGIIACIPKGERESLFARACSICNDLRGGF